MNAYPIELLLMKLCVYIVMYMLLHVKRRNSETRLRMINGKLCAIII